MMHRPRKRFGQHFLHDKAIIQRIVAALDPKPADYLIEIGPGQGALTFPILQKVKKLEVIEFDRDLVAALNQQANQKLLIHSADVLQFDFFTIKPESEMLRVFGNLPYNISTPLIFHLLTYANRIEDMLFMLQKEVADRLAACANTPEYGRLSVMVQYHCEVEILFDVPPQAFSPPPKVWSSIIRLKPYRKLPYPAKNYDAFAAIVKAAFGQRRKQLRNSLKEFIDDNIWAKFPALSHARAENLTVKDFVELSGYGATSSSHSVRTA